LTPPDAGSRIAITHPSNDGIGALLKIGRRASLPWLFAGAAIVCAWCSFLSGMGGWIMGQDLARREEQAKFATAGASQQDRVPLGVLVVRLDRSGPAERVGIQPGDTITAINGAQVESARDLRDQLLRYRPGDIVRLTVLRQREEDLTVRLEPFPGDGARPYLGIYYTARGDEPADL
jgi:membrane-associated protease RseP (regulator of RpoE activity)